MHSELRARIEALEEQVAPAAEAAPNVETPESRAARLSFEARLERLQDPKKTEAWNAAQERERQRFEALPWKQRHQIVEDRLAATVAKLAALGRRHAGHDRATQMQLASDGNRLRMEAALARYELHALQEEFDAKRHA